MKNSNRERGANSSNALKNAKSQVVSNSYHLKGTYNTVGAAKSAVKASVKTGKIAIVKK